MEEAIIKVTVDNSNGKKTVKEVQQELKSAEDQAKKTGSAISDGIGQAETKAVSLKAQLKALIAEMSTLPEGSARFKELAARAGEVKDRIGDIQERVNALSSDTKRLDALVRTGGAIAGGFQAASGAMALFGSDSKVVADSIKNIIAVQGILNGVQQVGIFLTTKQNGVSILDTAIKVKNVVATQAVTAAQWLWNAAVTANPIGLIVVAIGAMTVGVYKLVKGLKDGTITIEDITKVLWRMIMPLYLLVDLYNYIFDAVNKTETALERNSKENTNRFNKRLAEIRAERDEQEKAHNERQEQFDRDIARDEALGKSSYKLRLAKLEDIKAEKEAILQSYKDIINATIERYTIEAQLRGKSLEQFLTSIGINYDQTKAQLEKSLKDQEEAIYDSETEIIKIKTEHAQKAIDEKRKIDEAERQRLLKLEQEEEARQRKLIEDQQELANNKRERDRIAQEEAFQLEFDLLEAQIDRENAVRELQEQMDKERRERQFKDTIQSAENLIKISDSIATLAQGKEFQRIKAKQEAGERLTSSEIARLKRAEKAEKARAIAQVAIDTARGIAGAVAAGAGVPFPANIPAIISGVAAVIAGVAQAKTILGESGSSSSSASSAGLDSGANAIENTNTQEPKVIQSGSTFLNQEPMKVFVLESDITNTQKSVSVIQAAASFG